MNETTIETFNQFAEEYADFTFPNILQYELNRFISLIPKDSKILDLACGFGRDVHYFMDYGYEVLGVDASENMIKEAQERVPKGQFKVMHLESLDLPKEDFDAIWSLDALSFISKTELPKVLTTLHDVLKPAGLIFISVREGEAEKEIEYEKLGKSKILVSFFIQKELEKALVKAGFEIHNSFTQKGEDFTWINIYAKKK